MSTCWVKRSDVEDVEEKDFRPRISSHGRNRMARVQYSIFNSAGEYIRVLGHVTSQITGDH